MLTDKDKKQLAKIRKMVGKELTKLRVTEPKISCACDYRTKKLRLCYSVYEDRGVDAKGERIIRKKQKYMYPKNVSIYDDEIIRINLPKYVDEIYKRVDTKIKEISTDKDTIGYWAKLYYTNNQRYGNISLSEETLKVEKETLTKWIEWVEEHEPKMLNIWNWVDEGRDCLQRYMRHKQTIPTLRSKYHKKPMVWKDGSVNSAYRRMRGFFNWISTKVDGFPNGILNKMPFTPSKTITKSFNSQEMDKIKKFISDEKDSKLWGWFIPMLCVMLETGCRIKELCNMKINDVEPSTRIWRFKGKGQFGGKERIQRLPQYVWDMIEELIVDEDGYLRTDKEYVFHQRFYKPYNLKAQPDKWLFIEDVTTPFTHFGVRNKFKKMRKQLNLTEGLSPHSCRRYYITEMLKKTKGDIPLVADLVGHSTWDMVKRYAKSVIDDETITNIGLFDDTTSKTASVPIMITKKMRVELKKMMYSEEKIRTLTPIQAHEIIERGF